MNSLCKFLLYYFIFAELLFGRATPKINRALIKKINKMKVGWKAGVNKAKVPKRWSSRLRLNETVPPAPPTPEPDVGKMPNFFDARNRWRNCEKILTRVRDQGMCDSGWAVATASMLSDRTCIHSKGEIQRHLSANELMTCCTACFPAGQGPCTGGNPKAAVNYFNETGLLTGGEKDSYEGCQPYDRRFWEGQVVDKCESGCTNVGGTADRTKGEQLYRIDGEANVRNDIWKNGPVLAEIDVYEDMYYYKSGVYVHKLGNQLGVHWVKIIGWGARQSERYWLCMNSHGTDFGHGGTMKIKRGVNTCGIEDDIVAIKKPVGAWERRGSGDSNEGVNFQPSSVRCLVAEAIVFYLSLYMYA